MRPDLAALSPADRARALLSTARADLDGRLWRAALGGVSEGAAGASSPSYIARPDALDALLRQGMSAQPALPEGSTAMLQVVPSHAPQSTAISAVLAPANARYAGMMDAAAERTGIPAATLSAIIGAEAGRGADGAWNPLSRNPRSSAAGLGQFLSGTWLGLARQEGTWLNRYARTHGLVDAAGHIAPGAKAALLSLRYEPQAAIESVADYARATIARLRQSGVAVGDSTAEVSRAAYIGHHLGPGDALRFYNGGLSPARARALLSAQIGADKADMRITQAGDAARAHRGWLLGYIEKNIG